MFARSENAKKEFSLQSGFGEVSGVQGWRALFSWLASVSNLGRVP